PQVPPASRTYPMVIHHQCVPRQLPWRDWGEWGLVHFLLFSHNPGERRAGVSRVKAWRARERIPHAVDTTAQLVELSLLDGGRYPPGELELRLGYSCALIRGVNGLVEPGQKRSHATSVYALAEAMGLPSWLIDLRHNATHKDLPSLSLLRLAKDFLLGYLRERYWAIQAEHLEFLIKAFGQLLSRYHLVAERTISPSYSSKSSDASDEEDAEISSSKQTLDGCVSDILESTTPTAVAHTIIPLLTGGHPCLNGWGKLWGFMVPRSATKYQL
ncbi:unnamed protein product, partial [Chrysoparadoxa australica]